MARQISKRAFDLCVAAEVTSKEYYEEYYVNPEWPGLSSGPTVGIGYDLGQASRAKIETDWKGLVSDAMLQVMIGCSGFTGEAGKTKTAQVRKKIAIPWAAALHVFEKRDVPQWTLGVLQRIQGADKLPASCLGVLFDIAYNRGHSWSSSGERYIEMRNIKHLVETGDWARVPDQIKSMKRLWPKTPGLLRRCDDRAKLWAYGLANPNEPEIGTPTPLLPDKAVPQKEGAARTAPPATSPAQNTTAIVIGTAGAGAAKYAHAVGWASGWQAVGILAAALLAGAAVWYIWHRYRNPK